MITLQRSLADTGRLARQFRNARPYGHVVVDDLFDPDTIMAAAVEFPQTTVMNAVGEGGQKWELRDLSLTGAAVRELAEALTGPEWVARLSAITGIKDLRPGTGDARGVIREAGDGAQGGLHAPPSSPDGESLSRCVTIVVYLGRGWTERNGGVLELWDDQRRGPVASIDPHFNRAVIFATGPKTFHAQTMVRSAGGFTRRTLAAWYYTPVVRAVP